MEEQISIEKQTPQQVKQPSVSEIVQTPPEVPKEKPKLNYWMISTIALLIILIGGIIFYLIRSETLSSLFPTKFSQPSPETSSGLIASNQIRTGTLQLTYPKGWIPIFATPKDGKNLIYFAATKDEAKSLLSCAGDGTCSNYALKLEDFTNFAVWQNYSVEDFIKQVKPDIKLTQLQKTTLGGREAWWGYVDDKKLIHQTVVTAGNQQNKGFVAINATASEDGKQLMEQYVAQLPSIVISDYKEVKPAELSVKRGFIAEISSSLNTQDYFLLSFVLNSLLAPQNSTQNYHYSLFTESSKSEGSRIGGPNYPKDSYLADKYYLLTNNDMLREGLYGTPQIQIKLSTSDISNLGNYLADPKYCQQDGDCQYRANFCTVGAFNLYHQFYSPWGCGPADFENLGNSEELRTKLGCQTAVEVKYDAIRCVSNSCQIVNAQPACKQ